MTEAVLASLRTRPVRVPIDPPLQSAAGEIRRMPLLLLDVTDSDGATGHAYVVCFVDAVLFAAHEFARRLEQDAVGRSVAPRTAAGALPPRLRLAGRSGVGAMVLAALDMALWDLAARRAGQPLARLLGADPLAVRAYLSLRASHLPGLRAEAERGAAAGFTAFKVKLGHGEVDADRAAVYAVRAVAGAAATVMVDYNQTLTVVDAIDRARRLADLGVHWIEEPVDSDDHDAAARVRSRSPIPVQLGESWCGARDAARSIAAGASDLAMPDMMRIGGVTGWLDAAALCRTAALPLSSHLFAEVSAHLLAVAENRDWLEWTDIAGPVLLSPLAPYNGTVTARNEPGTGIDWDEAAATAFAAR